MRRLILFLLPVLIFTLAALTTPEPASEPTERAVSVVPDSTFDQAKALADLRERIAGRENEPAEQVFQNIRIMQGMPAGRVLPIMEMAFNNSLGVNCTHCHNPDNWESDEKPTKGVTRDMWNMVGRINRELLAGIDNLSSEQPAVNCTTCHRGDLKPALRME